MLVPSPISTSYITSNKMQFAMECMQFIIVGCLTLGMILFSTPSLFIPSVSGINGVIESSRGNCPLSPHYPISVCPAVPEMSPTIYFKWAKICLDDYAGTLHLRKEDKPSEGPNKEINKKEEDASIYDKMMDPHEPPNACTICLCQHFRQYFSDAPQRAWALQQSLAEETSVSLS